MKKEILKALCPTCGGLRNCTVHGKLTTSWEDSQYPVYGYHYHHLLQCNGCDTDLDPPFPDSFCILS